MEKYKYETKSINYKICRKCLDPKSLTDFNIREGNHLTSWCKLCLQKYKHDDHIKNKIKDYNKKRDRISNNRRIILDYLKTHPCVDCGENDILVLELDHVRGDKIGDVCRMATNGVGEKALKEEIDKCDSRCANCHRRRTIKSTKNHWRLKTSEYINHEDC